MSSRLSSSSSNSMIIPWSIAKEAANSYLPPPPEPQTWPFSGVWRDSKIPLDNKLEEEGKLGKSTNIHNLKWERKKNTEKNEKTCKKIVHNSMLVHWGEMQVISINSVRDRKPNHDEIGGKKRKLSITLSKSSRLSPKQSELCQSTEKESFLNSSYKTNLPFLKNLTKITELNYKLG